MPWSSLAKKREYNKKYREAHKEYFRQYGLKYRGDNKEYFQAYHQSHPRPGHQATQEYHRKYREVHKDRVKEWRRRWYEKAKKSPSWRLSFAISHGVHRGLILGKGGQKTWKILGYTISDLKNRLESLFAKGMTWENYGKWHIDHIIPLGFFAFKSTDDVEFKMCWRLENLQPLWAADNCKKSAKMPDFSRAYN